MSPIHIEPKSLKNILAKWAREPYPSVISPWKVVVVPAVIIFLVLYLLQPFGIARIGSGKLWVTLGSACISAGVSSLFVWVGHVGLALVHHRVRVVLRVVALRGDAGRAPFFHGAALGVDIGGFPHRALRDVEPQYPVGKKPA